MTGDHIPTIHALEQRFEKKEFAIPEIDVLMARSDTLPVLLKPLRLSTVAQLRVVFSDPCRKGTPRPGQYRAALCEHELNERYNRRMARFTKASRLPIGKASGGI